MRIILARGSDRDTLVFDPSRVAWKRQAGEFIVGFQTGLSDPFGRVFIKRFGTPAVAHNLLTTTCGRAVPGLPCFYGYAAEAGQHYYVSENLPASFALVEHLLISKGAIAPIDLVSEPFISAAVKQAVQSFAALWAEGYVYTDFCAKNILRDDRETIRLIDVDSCWPITRLASERYPSGIAFDIKFWGLWNTHAAAAASGGEERAPRALVLSFAAVWLRALALKCSGDTAGAVALVRDPSAAKQQPLWDALAARNGREFAAYFLTAAASAAHGLWQSMFDALKAGQTPHWSEVVRAVGALADAVKSEVVISPLTSSRPSAPPRAALPTPPPVPAHLAFSRRLISTIIAEALVIGVIVLVGAFLAAAVKAVPELVFGVMGIPLAYLQQRMGCISILLLPVVLVVGLAAGAISLVLGLTIFFAGVVVMAAMAVCSVKLLQNLFAEPANYYDPLAYAMQCLKQVSEQQLSRFRMYAGRLHKAMTRSR
jgi:hypothetical protein